MSQGRRERKPSVLATILCSEASLFAGIAFFLKGGLSTSTFQPALWFLLINMAKHQVMEYHELYYTSTSEALPDHCINPITDSRSRR
jgi:hypothetical protein